MQHGTAREYVVELLENVQAITTKRETRRALRMALIALEDMAQDLDKPGVYGPDYGTPRVTNAERDEALRVRNDVVGEDV